MDPIWLCVTTMLLHLLLNRLFGRLSGWWRVCHWPAMQLAAMTGHVLFANPLMLWLVQLSRSSDGMNVQSDDLLASVFAALAAAIFLRFRAHSS